MKQYNIKERCFIDESVYGNTRHYVHKRRKYFMRMHYLLYLCNILFPVQVLPLLSVSYSLNSKSYFKCSMKRIERHSNESGNDDNITKGSNSKDMNKKNRIKCIA